jgi:large repetitive protein
MISNTYAGDNPVNMVDPSGNLQAWEVAKTYSGNAAVGGAIGGCAVGGVVGAAGGAPALGAGAVPGFFIGCGVVGAAVGGVAAVGGAVVGFAVGLFG